MERERLVKVVEEVRQQCRFGWLAWQGLRSSLGGMDSEGAFFYVHAFLGRARMASRFLWPEGEGAAARGASVREVLKVGDGSALNGSGLKVFAESGEAEFDRWLSGLGHCRYLGMNIMPQGTMSDFRQDVFLRSLDPEVFEFRWYEQSIDLRKIADGLRAVETVADRWLKRQ